jgi:hypothetical protein
MPSACSTTELLFHSLNRNLGMSPDLSQFSMHDLFRLEVEGQREVLTRRLQLEAARRRSLAAEGLHALGAFAQGARRASSA